MQLPELTGQQLGKYKLAQMLGVGGMGAVYESYQTSVKRKVAVKILPVALAQESGYVERFQREVKLAARLEHPHILPIYDHGTEGDLSYVVMRYVSGGTLEDRMSEFRDAPMSRILRFIDQIANALDYAHHKNIIHRDIKTANILFDDEENAYLADFGIAKVIQEGTMGANLTASGEILGTPHYMPPEQWQAMLLDNRADVYAFGVVIYQLLTGQYPFDGETLFTVMDGHLNEPIPLPSTIDPIFTPEVDTIFEKVLAKNPEDRFNSASDFATSLATAFEAKSDVNIAKVVPIIPKSSKPAVIETSKDSSDIIEDSVQADYAPTITGLATPNDAVNTLEGDTVAMSVTNKKPLRFLIVGGVIALIIITILIAMFMLNSSESDSPTITHPYVPIIEFNDADSYQDLLLYDPETGRAGFYTLTTEGDLVLIKEYSDWAINLQIMVAQLNNDSTSDIVRYDSTLGQIELLIGNGNGELELLNRIEDIPLNQHIQTGDFNVDTHTDFVLYDPDSGLVNTYIITPSGDLSSLTSPFNIGSNLQLKSGLFNDDNITDLIAYNADTGITEVYTFGLDSALRLFTQIEDWRPNWEFFPANFDDNNITDVLIYDANFSTAEIYTSTGESGFVRLSRMVDWRSTWGKISPISLNDDVFADLFLQDITQQEAQILISDVWGDIKFAKQFENWDTLWTIITGNFAL
jgi:serine/threonine protein kinase